MLSARGRPLERALIIQRRAADDTSSNRPLARFLAPPRRARRLTGLSPSAADWFHAAV
jgi:hypothetical protein